MPQGAIRHVFVYGTLRRGGRNDINRLAPAPRYLGMSEVKGCLYHIDWYPGLTLGEFHDGLRDLRDSDRIRLIPFTRALATIPDARNALYLDGEVMYYVQPA